MDGLVGRRRDDTPEGKLPEEIAVGDYWKIIAANGEPKLKNDHPGKLTMECWHVVVPMGTERGYGIANLSNHTVREHEDGTISVRPGDGSSNSILVTGAHGKQWHGYIEKGVLLGD